MSAKEPTVRDTAKVTVKRAVDGTKKRKTRSDKGSTRQLVEVSKVDRRVWTAVQELVAAGTYTRVEIVDEGTVIVR